jgi:DmsE family decaheme c-type cytochrome
MPVKSSGPGAFLPLPLISRKALVLGASVLALLVTSVTAGQDKPKTEAKQAAPEQSGAAQPASAPAGPAKYVGAETCAGCHEDIFKAFQKNRHDVINTAGGKWKKWNGQPCEACHGPGSIHAESADAKDIFNPAKQPAGTADARCLSCHLNTPTPVGRLNGGHARDTVACASCHSIHGEPKREALNCTSCHGNNWAQFNQPMGHKLGKNLMSCVDCHNPHGGITVQSRISGSLKAYAANEPGCFRCHGELRGPFTYEHAPVHLDGCTSCHSPHNSVNPYMLNRSAVRFTCLECHSNLSSISKPTLPSGSVLGGVPPGFHDMNNPRYQNCTICHIKVHGSYTDRNFLR